MGIPSYYKKLADHVKGLVSRTFEGKPTALYFDFNCMIYHCARRSNSKLPPYPGMEGQTEWEDLLLEDIVKYITKVWQDVGQPAEVFFAVDGVVPMAKIKQQRMRRFKSVWLAQKEKEEGLRDNTPSWDTNCITPGTSFLRRLTKKLQQLCSKHPHWSVSGGEEPGEGEHKVMAKLRARTPDTNPVLVYGLDADLILLSMLNAKSPVYLVREASEMGAVQLDTFGEEQLSFFSIDVLKKTLPPTLDPLTYGAAMSLLGNDFLPHSLTIKMRDDGHAKLLKSLSQLETPLLERKNDRWVFCHESLLALLREWADEEDQRMLGTLKKKIQMRGRMEQTLENKPLEWMVEEGLVWKGNDGWMLHPQWKTVYNRDWLACEGHADQMAASREYVSGLQWILDYYIGQASVDKRWSFPRLVPPLWCTLVRYLETHTHEEPVWQDSSPIQPAEQLAMVLPLESWHFVEDPDLRYLPTLLPQFWPSAFGFFSVGRSRLWECEALVPSLSVDRVRAAVTAAKE